jgi:hypothetical protein
MAFPASPADGQTTIINGVTYIYSLTNVSWSPYASNSTVAYTSIAVSGNANVTGTTTSGTEIVTGNETVGGNSYVTGTLTAGSVVSASLIKRAGQVGNVDLNASTYFIGSQVLGFDIATNKPGNSYGVLINIQERSDTAAQLVIDYDTGNLYSRGIYVPSSVSSGNTPSYSSWKTMLHSANYNSYSPTLTGTGASGTWSIGISGNAATATSATSALNTSSQSSTGSTNFNAGTLLYSAIQQGGRSYEAHDFNSYPNLYSTIFINTGASSNLPSGFGINMGYRFIMGAGDTTTRGFDLVGSSEPALWYRERSNGNWNKVISSYNGTVSVTGNIIPAATNTYDLGTSSLRWRNVYTNDLNLSNGIGDYTIVEGEDDLFLYNNKKGKVYKFALIEVDPKDATPKIDELK